MNALVALTKRATNATVNELESFIVNRVQFVSEVEFEDQSQEKQAKKRNFNMMGISKLENQ